MKRSKTAGAAALPPVSRSREARIDSFSRVSVFI